MRSPDRDIPDAVIADLVQAAAGRTRVAPGSAASPGADSAGNRPSSEATIDVPVGRVALSPHGLEAFESAMRWVLGHPGAARWDPDDLRELIAAFVAALPEDEPSQVLAVSRRLGFVLNHSTSLVAFRLANVAWEGDPVQVANGVVGRLDRGWSLAMEAAAGEQPSLRDLSSDPPWLQAPDPGAVAFGVWLPMHGTRATRLAAATFDDLVAAALMLEVDGAEVRRPTLGGDTQRPGIRGLRIDRSALRSAAGGSVGDELVAHMVQLGPAGERIVLLGELEERFPLERLLSPDRRDAVDGITRADDEIHRRLRTAANWHARFHWASTDADATLSLGVAFDALLGDPGRNSGRIVVERSGLLEPIDDRRAESTETMRRFFEARNAVAHGGDGAELSQPLVADAGRQLRLTARRLIELAAVVDLRTERDVRRAFDRLRRGTLEPAEPRAGR